MQVAGIRCMASALHGCCLVEGAIVAAAYDQIKAEKGKENTISWGSARELIPGEVERDRREGQQIMPRQE